ncbi:MAG: hypothetical protein QOD75_718 [Blastocatellia bacterium]|nr:hypothetical protein [Blastocatellia bacterium]
MKTIGYAAIFSLLVMSIATPWTSSAHPSGPSASGNYRFTLEDDMAKTVEFSATADERGTATGQFTFTDEARIVEQDVNGAGDPTGESSGLTLTADLDTLTITGNRAVMGGVVRDSNNRNYIGRWVQLVVEDNGDGREVADKLSWCFCQPEPGGWIPADSEVPHDDGAWSHWWVTDPERRDDVGIPSPNLIPGTRRGCPTIPLANYIFDDVKSGEGQIQVTP